MESSDSDAMTWPKNICVFETLQQVQRHYDSYGVVLIMDTSITSPGYAALQVVKLNDNVLDGLKNDQIEMFQRTFLSSAKFREQWHRASCLEIHGPCVKGNLGKSFHYDIAYCVHSKYWPTQARDCVKRLYKSGWPSVETITRIVQNGCNLVPVASKTPRFRETVDIEWRISFALAEKTLIHFMAHYQLLCYGLLKIFLNEAINKTDGLDDLLCSYFLKTAMFWELTHTEHSNTGILTLFWNVFSRIIGWVQNGYCPNFFMPNNNLFATKIYGKNQQLLFCHLKLLYAEGYKSLFRCLSIRDAFIAIVEHQPLSFSESANTQHCHRENSDFLTRLEMNLMIPGLLKIPYEMEEQEDIGYAIDNLKNAKPTSDAMASTIEIGLRTNWQLFYTQCLHKIRKEMNITENKITYHRLKHAIEMLHICEPSVGSSSVIESLYFYTLGNYNRSAHMALRAREELKDPNIMYIWTRNVKIYQQCRAEGISQEEFVPLYMACALYKFDVTGIEELKLEKLVVDELCREMHIPPLVMVCFLLVHNFYKMHKRNIWTNDVIPNMKLALKEFQTLLENQNNHIHSDFLAISWEMFGICLELCGNNEEAYRCYVKALEDEYNVWEKASIVRIICLVFNLLNKLSIPAR